MPNKNGTGPNGEGPMTGRGLGNCPPPKVENKDDQEVLTRGRKAFSQRIGQGLGRGQGRGLGQGRGQGQGRGRS